MDGSFWNRNNLRKIGEVWGDVVCFDKSTELGELFQSAKILVDTLFTSSTEEELLLSLSEGGFRIQVKEINFMMVSNCFKASSLVASSPCSSSYSVEKEMMGIENQ